MLNLPFLHWFLEGPLQVLEVRSFRGRPVDAQGRCVAGGLPLQYLNQKSFVGKSNHSDFLPEIFIFLSAFQYKILHLGVDFYHKNVIFRPSVPCLFSKYFTERNIKFQKKRKKMRKFVNFYLPDSKFWALLLFLSWVCIV